MTKPNPSLESLRFPRTQREAGWSPHADWDNGDSGISSILWVTLWAAVGAIALWVFFTLALGWSA